MSAALNSNPPVDLDGAQGLQDSEQFVDARVLLELNLHAGTKYLCFMVFACVEEDNPPHSVRSAPLNLIPLLVAERVIGKLDPQGLRYQCHGLSHLDLRNDFAAFDECDVHANRRGDGCQVAAEDVQAPTGQ